MFKSVFNDYLVSIYRTLLETDNKVIRKNVDKLLKLAPEEEHVSMMMPLIAMLATDVIPYSFDEDDSSVYENAVKSYVKMMEDQFKSIKVKAYIADIPQVYREMDLPYGLFLNDLALYVLAAFGCDGSHMYNVSIKKKVYDCLDNPEDNISLSTARVKKGTTLVVHYDFGECYDFVVEIEEVVKEKIQRDILTGKLISYSGLDIFEDNKHLMELYYSDEEEFNKYVEENGLDEWVEDYLYENDEMDDEDYLIDEYFELASIYDDSEGMDGFEGLDDEGIFDLLN